jgi:hypothetical protein
MRKSPVLRSARLHFAQPYIASRWSIWEEWISLRFHGRFYLGRTVTSSEGEASLEFSRSAIVLWQMGRRSSTLLLFNSQTITFLARQANSLKIYPAVDEQNLSTTTEKVWQEVRNKVGRSAVRRTRHKVTGLQGIPAINGLLGC